MKYRELTTEFMGASQKHIIIENDDGSFKSFPADILNSEYITFLDNIENYEKVVE
jgi:hypothetical protein